MRILVTGTFGREADNLSALRDLGHDLTVVYDESGPLPDSAYQVDGVICNGLFLHHEPDEFPNLQFVQVTSAGLDRIPVDVLEPRGVKVFNAAGVYSIPMAEWVVMQVLQIYKRARFFERNQQERRWEKARDLRELSGKTACIVGFGHVGREVATRLRAFGVRIIAVGRSRVDSPMADVSVTIELMPEVLPESDFVVLSLPLTPETKHLIGSAAISSMKSDAVLVNVSRGAVVDETALVDALEEGKLLGVALDVFEEEPLTPSSSLWSTDRVYITPHNSFVSDRTSARLLELTKQNLDDLNAQVPDRQATELTLMRSI